MTQTLGLGPNAEWSQKSSHRNGATRCVSAETKCRTAAIYTTACLTMGRATVFARFAQISTTKNVTKILKPDMSSQHTSPLPKWFLFPNCVKIGVVDKIWCRVGVAASEKILSFFGVRVLHKVRKNA